MFVRGELPSPRGDLYLLSVAFYALKFVTCLLLLSSDSACIRIPSRPWRRQQQDHGYPCEMTRAIFISTGCRIPTSLLRELSDRFPVVLVRGVEQASIRCTPVTPQYRLPVVAAKETEEAEAAKQKEDAEAEEEATAKVAITSRLPAVHEITPSGAWRAHLSGRPTKAMFARSSVRPPAYSKRGPA